MARAAVFIGVDKTGDLPVLQDAAAGATRLYKQWAREQGLGPAALITDEKGPVTADAIQDRITEILEPGNIEQLFVYFAGHGVNVRMGEYWLLSDAPKKSQAAVNVSGSDYLARYCGVSHVVFISDACRTAADTISAQNVVGTDIFPNEQVSDTQKPVDLFYSCALGRPAHEARDVTATAAQFKALYTAAVDDALRFRTPQIADWITEEGREVAVIRPRALRDHLRDEVTRRIRALNLQNAIIQVPDAHITSDPDAWLSRKADVQRTAGAPTSGAPPGGGGPELRTGLRLETASTEPARSTMQSLSRSLVSLAIADPRIVSDAIGIGPTAGPHSFETQCGIKIRGARIAEAFAVGASIEQMGPSRDVIRVDHARRPGASVLMVLDSGMGIVLPPIPDFIAALTVEDGDLIDVAYEPSANTWRAEEYRRSAKHLHALRTVIGSACRTGTLRLERRQDALELAKRLQSSKGVDPSLAVYAAYAYDGLHRLDLLKMMRDYMAGDLGAPLFDVAMLANDLDNTKPEAVPPLYGFAPLLAQGWASLQARRIPLPPGTEGLAQTVTDSLWTMFRPEGVAKLRETYFKAGQPWRPA